MAKKIRSDSSDSFDYNNNSEETNSNTGSNVKSELIYHHKSLFLLFVRLICYYYNIRAVVTRRRHSIKGAY